MTRLTRRQALGCAIAGAIVPLIVPSVSPVVVDLVDPGAHEFDIDDDTTPRDVARFVACWELLAQQQNRPSKWKRLHYTGALQWRLQSEGRLPLIAWYGIGTPDQVADHADCKLVMVDTLAKFRAQRDRRGSVYDEDYSAVSAMKDIADKRGVSFVVCHHLNQGKSADPLEQINGTSGLTGAADSTLVLKRERGKHDASLFCTGRDVTEAELAMRFDQATGQWSIIGAADDYRLTKESLEVINVLRKADQPMRPKDVATELGILSNTASQRLTTMAARGQISALGDGQYTHL